MLLNLFTESICKAYKSAHKYSNGQILVVFQFGRMKIHSFILDAIVQAFWRIAHLDCQETYLTKLLEKNEAMVFYYSSIAKFSFVFLQFYSSILAENGER
jgi:hypothetical protein